MKRAASASLTLALLAGARRARRRCALPTFAEVKAAHRPSDVDAARPPRRADPDRARRQGRAPPRRGCRSPEMSPALLHGARAERGPALLRAQRRRLGRGGEERLGQRLEHAHARRVDADDAARRPARRRPGAPGRRPQRRAEARPGADARRELEAAWKKSEILEAYLNLGAVSRRDRRHRCARADAVRQAPERTRLRRRRRSPRRWCAARTRTPRRWRSAPAACSSCKRLGCDGVAALRRDRALRAAAAMPLGEQLAPHFARAGASTRTRRRRRTRVSTTLDARAAARSRSTTLRRQLAELAGRNVEDGAVVVLDNATGEVLAWVGSTRRPVAARRRSTACSRAASPARR